MQRLVEGRCNNPLGEVAYAGFKKCPGLRRSTAKVEVALCGWHQVALLAITFPIDQSLDLNPSADSSFI